MTEQPPNDPTWGAPAPGQEGSVPPPGWGPPPPGSPPPPPGYGMPPGYGPPGYPPPMGTSQQAIWALVAAIVGFCCGPVGVVGIVLGKQSMDECNRTGQPGAGLGQAAFIVGIVSTVVWALWLLVRFV